MRIFWVNTFFFINLIGIALAIPYSVAANFETFKAGGLGILAVIAVIDLLMFLPAFWILASSDRLPRRAYLPLLFGYIFPYLTLGILPGWLEVTLNFFYLAISIYCIKQRASLSGNFFGILSDEQLNKEHVRFSRFLPVLAIILTGFFLVSFTLAFRAAEFFVREGAKDVLKLKLDGIYTKTQTFTKGDQTAKVFSMMHYGDRIFYQHMFEKIPNESTLVMLEGIKDRAKFLGDGRPHGETFFGIPSQFGIFNPKVEKERQHLNADIDVIDLSPEVRAFKVKDARQGSLMTIALASKNERAKIMSLNQKAKDERNKHLMSEFDKYSPSYKTIVFTWGAGHSAYISKSLMERGYKLSEEKDERAFSFW